MQMEIQSKRIKLSSIFIKYIIANKLLSGLIIYFIISIILKVVTSVDIQIPCLWKSIFGIRCLGCGLTTASMKIIQFDFKAAFNSNPLIFIVLPTVLFYMVTDFLKFRKNIIN